MTNWNINLGYDYSATSPATSLGIGIVSVADVNGTLVGTNNTFNNVVANDTINAIWLFDLTKLSNPNYVLPNQATGTQPLSPGANFITFNAADSGTTPGTAPFTLPTSPTWVSIGNGNPTPTWPSGSYPCWYLSGGSMSVSTQGSWNLIASLTVQLVNAQGPITGTEIVFGVDPEMIVSAGSGGNVEPRKS